MHAKPPIPRVLKQCSSRRLGDPERYPAWSKRRSDVSIQFRISQILIATFLVAVFLAAWPLVANIHRNVIPLAVVFLCGCCTRFAGWHFGRWLSSFTRHVLSWFFGTLGCSLAIIAINFRNVCLLYTSPSPRDRTRSRMPSSA